MNKTVVLGGRFLSPYIQSAFSLIGVSVVRIKSKETKQFLESLENSNIMYTIIDAFDPARSNLINEQVRKRLENTRSKLLKNKSINTYCYLSSGLVYKESTELITEEHETVNETPYQRLKNETEKMIQDSELRQYCLRLTNIWSHESAKDTFMGNCLSSKYKDNNKSLSLRDEDFTKAIDLIHAEDAAKAIALVLTKEIKNGTYNISSGARYKIADIKNYFINGSKLSKTEDKVPGRILANGKLIKYTKASVDNLEQALEKEDRRIYR